MELEKWVPESWSFRLISNDYSMHQIVAILMTIHLMRDVVEVKYIDCILLVEALMAKIMLNNVARKRHKYPPPTALPPQMHQNVADPLQASV